MGSGGEPETVNLYQCGGSLIAPGVILTAAHCVDKFRQNPTELKIRCGGWDTQHQTEPYPHQDRDVQNLAIHPEFDGRNLQNDFAVLFTNGEFVLDQHIDTACLPAADEIFDEAHVSLLDGARISLELQDNIRWFSRRLIFLLSTMESVKTSSEPPDLDRNTSSMTPSS